MHEIDVMVINKALGTGYAADDLVLDAENNRLVEASSGKEVELNAETLAEIAREKRKTHAQIMSNYV
jgi:hypothetical protein